MSLKIYYQHSERLDQYIFMLIRGWGGGGGRGSERGPFCFLKFNYINQEICLVIDLLKKKKVGRILRILRKRPI